VNIFAVFNGSELGESNFGFLIPVFIFLKKKNTAGHTSVLASLKAKRCQNGEKKGIFFFTNLSWNGRTLAVVVRPDPLGA